MSDPILPSFRYRLPPHTGRGDLVRGASVRQFPVSQGIAGASMRLQPGCLRELHWHTTAPELGYVVSASCRTTVSSPDGAATDTFGSGDVWYFPRGYIRNTGCGILRLLIGFNNGHCHSHDLSAWLASYPPDVLAANLGFPRTAAEALHKERLFIARSPEAR